MKRADWIWLLSFVGLAACFGAIMYMLYQERELTDYECTRIGGVPIHTRTADYCIAKSAVLWSNK